MVKLFSATIELILMVVILLVRLFIRSLLSALVVAGAAYVFTLVLVNMFGLGHLLDFWLTAKILFGVFFALDFMYVLYKIGTYM